MWLFYPPIIPLQNGGDRACIFLHLPWRMYAAFLLCSRLILLLFPSKREWYHSEKKEEFVLCAGASLHFLSFFFLRTERLVRCLCKVQRIERALKWLFHRKENAGTLDWAMSKWLAKLPIGIFTSASYGAMTVRPQVMLKLFFSWKLCYLWGKVWISLSLKIEKWNIGSRREQNHVDRAICMHVSHIDSFSQP
jgi:hypothetical protein